MRISTGAPTPDEAGAISRFLGGALGAKIFFSIVFVVIAALGGALFLTKRGADRAADESVNKALAATQSAIQDALGSRAQSLLQVTAGLVWRRGAVTRDTVRVVMGDKSFQPSVLVVPSGTTIGYLNTDGFNHNVFSLSPEGPFDLGLYGRGQERHTTLTRAGVLRVYCNVHATMSAYVVVRDNPYFTQPSGDGSFRIAGVPPGRYQLLAWHERAGEVLRQPVQVTETGIQGLELQLDARGYERVQHANKHGRPYSRRGRRY